MDVRERARRGVALVAAAGGLALLGVMIPLAPTLGGLVVTLVVAGTFAIGVTQIVFRGAPAEHRQRILRWTMASFGLHVGIGLVVASVGLLISYLGPDAHIYDGLARQLLASWNGGARAPQLPAGKGGFVELLAFFYRFGAPTLAVGAVMNAGLAAGVVPLMSDAAERLMGRAEARLVPPLLALCPPLVLWSSQVLREAGVAFLLAVMACASARLIGRYSLVAMGTLVLACAFLLTFRGPLAYALLLSVVLAVTIGRQNLVVGIANGASVVLALVLVVGVVGLGYSGYRFSSARDLEDVNTFRSAVGTEAASGFDTTTKVKTVGDAIAYLPRAIPRTLLGPFPTDVHGTRQLPAIIDAVVWWWFLFHVLRGFQLLRRRVNRRRLLVLLLPASVVTIVLGLSVGNYGLLVRERPQIMVFLVPLAAFSLEARRLIVRERADARVLAAT